MPKFEKGNPGRVPGSTNRLTRTVKEVVLDTFNKLQESKEHNLVAFAKKNPRDFYAIAAKLIPTDIKADVKTVQKITLNIVRTNPNAAAGDTPPEPTTGAGQQEAL